MVDYKFLDRIRQMLKDENKIGIYGTGKAAEKLYKYIEEADYTGKIIAFIDRKESNRLNTYFYGLKVCELDEVINKVDTIVVSSELYWRQIEERIEKYLIDSKINKKVISVYNFDTGRNRDNSPEDCTLYVEYLEENKKNIGKYFCEMAHVPYTRTKEDPKLISWFLPQYYQMEVNDKFHGKGFTDWTRVAQTMPLFVGHEQPHVPYDVGFYDLSHDDIMKRQIELAKMYGIYGFCFHYYWFSGQRTMEKPIYNFLNNKELDIPFCLNWATENWTSTWDGGNFDLIFEQKFEKGDEIKFMEDILPFMKDDRYIKINGAPLLAIYSTKMFKKSDFVFMMKSFRRIAKENGFPDLYIMIGNYAGFDEDINEYGCDALVEFPPAGMSIQECKKEINGYMNPYFAGEIYDYKQYVESGKCIENHNNKKVFRSVLVGFDNTARKPRWGGLVLVNSSPIVYKKWLKMAINGIKNDSYNTDNILFVNSWNEWAEGSHLEPDLRYGYGYLQATLDAIYESRPLNTTYVDNKVERFLSEGKSIIFIILCIESMGDIIACEPIAEYLKKRYPDSTCNWVVRKKFAEIVKYNRNIDSIIEVDCLKEAIDYSKNHSEESVIVNCHYNNRRCVVTNEYNYNPVNPQVNENTYFNYGALLENFCLAAGMEPLNVQPVFHFNDKIVNPFNNERYIVFHCKSAEERKDWQKGNWIELAKWLIQRGYKVVEVGLECIVEVENDLFIDYTGEKDIQLIAKVISGALLFVGVDSGFAHVANCLKKDGLILMGSYGHFEHPMPYTGYYRENEDSMILYAHEGTVKNISLDEVEKMITDKLESI